MKIHYLRHFKKNRKNENFDINFSLLEKYSENCFNRFKNNDECFNYNNYSTSERDEIIKGINQESFIIDKFDINDKDNQINNSYFFSSLSSVNDEINSCLDS